MLQFNALNQLIHVTDVTPSAVDDIEISITQEVVFLRSLPLAFNAGFNVRY
ncbi:MAG: hypothetical protein V3T17_01990 [Pseudomonadales bacterium]